MVPRSFRFLLEDLKIIAATGATDSFSRNERLTISLSSTSQDPGGMCTSRSTLKLSGEVNDTPLSSWVDDEYKE